jgi:hypothetical protein
MCTTNKIKLFIVFSPNYYDHNYKFEDRLRKSGKKNVSFFVYDTLNNAYKDKSNFYDKSHLLTKGAIIFTNELINELRAELRH